MPSLQIKSLYVCASTICSYILAIQSITPFFFLNQSKKNYFKRESKGEQKTERSSFGVTIQDLGGERGIMQATGMGICRRRLPQQFNRLKDVRPSHSFF
jgi:hypothetical protein